MDNSARDNTDGPRSGDDSGDEARRFEGDVLPEFYEDELFDASTLPAPSRNVVADDAPLDQQPTVIRKPTELPRIAVRPTDLARGLEGQQLGHYRLDEFVGGGGMGAVFRGHDLELSRTVAVKVVPCEATDEDGLRRFKNEAQSAARLDHARIARVFNVGSDEHWHFIVFEFIEGVNIRDLVQHKGPLSLDEALLYTRQVAEALDHASQRDVVHRDIKPSNVLVMQDGSAKVVDFGLARLHHVESASEDLTQSGMMFGTFDFIPPEQAKDPRSTDVRSDLYSLGCTMYYMLVGQAPFPDGTVLQKLLRHSSEIPERIESLRPDLPKSVGDIVDKLLAKRQLDRFQTPAELIEALDEAAAASGISLGGTLVTRRLTQTKPPHPLLHHVAWLAPIAGLLMLFAALEWPSSEAGSPPRGPRLLPAIKSEDPTVTASPEPASPTATLGNIRPLVKISDTMGEAAVADEAYSAGPPELRQELVAVNLPVDPRRLVLQKPGDPSVSGVAAVNSLAEVAARLNDTPELTQVELRFNGELSVAPIRLSVDREIEFVAAEGYRPRLTFSTPGGEQGRSMLAFSSGRWKFRGIDFTMLLPNEYPAEMWTLFQLLDDAQRLDVHDSVMSIVCQRANLHDRTSFVQVAVREDRADPEQESATTRMPPVASFVNCMARGDASLIHSPEGSPIVCHFNQSVLATSRYVVEASGGAMNASAMPTMKNTIRLSVDQSTIYARSGGVLINMAYAAQLPGLNVYLDRCAIDCSGSEDRAANGLIVHRSVTQRELAENFTQLGGVDNLIEASLLNHSVPDSPQPSGWRSNAVGVVGDEGPVWPATLKNRRVAELKPSDFELSSADDDGEPAGAPIDALKRLLPAEEVDAGE